ncbi:hypothetical protein GSI_03438 [Ganoderma sinense ZZ0214-1]|uniref:F-box domain-containing protein n=1 Tax=Ganoderma sinense ZZ0214-1 TaxID=1077348 RepID=A0A2G8SM54_9APHY|nr:hypothetical protein GSI_03438 [Ganoderma sinense ZZ0214-1]
MPLLEELLLQGHRGPHFGARITFQRFPRLRNLALSQTVVPADVSLFAQLRVLTLSFCSYDFSFDVFLDILAASVQLENLTLYGALSYPSDEWLRGDPSTTSPISIPRLRKLTMENHSIVHTSRFLAHVHLPPTVSLLIIGDYEAELSPLNAMLPPNRSATLPILAIATEVAMTVQGDDYRFKLICDAPQPLPVPNQGASAPSSSRRLDASRLHAVFALLRSDYDEWDPFMAQGLEDLVESMAMGQPGLGSPLTQLTVTGVHDHATADAWERVFRTFPALEVLKISGDPCSHVTDVFRGLHAASTTRADSQSQSSVACWDLRHVEVEGLGVVETYAAMEECFRYRSDKGVVVKVLDLVNLPDAEGLTLQARQAFVKDLSRMVECVQVFDDEQESDEQESDEQESDEQESDGSASNGSESDDSEM